MHRIDRRRFLARLGQGALGLACGGSLLSRAFCAGDGRSEPPNIVFILIDDLGWKDTGCYGSRFFATPHIDRLAQQGMRFTFAYAAAPVCSPTRASIMTGRYPARVGLTQIVAAPREGLAPDEITIAERLKSAGYATGHFGKWHLGGERMYPERQGFDVNVGGTHIGMPLSFFYPAWKGNEHEQGAIGGVPLDGAPGDYLPDRLTDEALEFIRTHKHGPFFLHMAYYAVHIPYEAQEETIERYRARIRPDDPQDNAVYGAMVDSVDRNVGRILHTLDELGCADSTMVIFFSDNGGLAQQDDSWPPATSHTPLRAGKGWLYEGGIREPLIVRWPGVVSPGSTCNVPVCSIDFFPTLCATVGLEPDGTRSIDGVSLMPLLTQSGTIDRDTLYWHFPVEDIGPPAGAIRHGDYKLIEFFDDGRIELYNLRKDVGERNNLAEVMPEKTAALHKMLIEWRRSVGVTERK